MADTKRGRDKQARNAERRQRRREIDAALERGDEPEPPIDNATLDELEAEIEPLAFPATGSDIVETVGDREVESIDGVYVLEELVPDSETETFASVEAFKRRVRRPAIAVAMKRVIEASESLMDAEVGASQRSAYERTFRELDAIGAMGDEGIETVADWIVSRIRENESIPGSRAVRREAAAFCRENGYDVRTDEWLGI